VIKKTHLQDPSFQQPQDPGASVWRYIDVPRFVSMLQNRGLYYARVDHLPDEYEGGWGECLEGTRLADPVFGKLLKHGSWASRQMVRLYYVNCWRLQPGESDALWRIYTGGPSGGIAIRTTYRQLVEELPETDYIGEIQYLDYGSEAFDPHYIANFLMHKRLQFSHEREVRIVRTVETASFQDQSVAEMRDRLPIGVDVPVDLSKVVQAVVVSPYAPEWHLELVRGLVKAHGFEFPVVLSEMARLPFTGSLFADVSYSLRLKP